VEPTDPLYVHPSDNPAQPLVSNVFNGDNFDNWKRSVFIALSARHKLGFTHSENDYSLFCKREGNSVVFLAVYIDDIILTGNDEVEISSLKGFLDSNFKNKDLGHVHLFPGIEILHTDHGLLLTQRKFANELLQEFDCSSLNAVVWSLDYTVKLHPDEGEILHDPTTYCRLIGKLNFLTHTRLDIAFAVQHLSQFLQSPRHPHMKAAIHVL